MKCSFVRNMIFPKIQHFNFKTNCSTNYLIIFFFTSRLEFIFCFHLTGILQLSILYSPKLSNMQWDLFLGPCADGLFITVDPIDW